MANVRNFWVDGNIDGRTTPMYGGPIKKDGGFSLKIFQRSEKNITTALYVRGYADEDGTLTLIVEDGNGNLVYKNSTVR